MTALSWLYLGIVWAAIIALNVFCFYRVFTKKTDNTNKTEDE
jgi:hypothetical protein